MRLIIKVLDIGLPVRLSQMWGCIKYLQPLVSIMGLHVWCPGSNVSGLPDSSNRVCGHNDQSRFFILEAAYGTAARAVACSSAHEECSEIPLTVMTPRGPGILSVR